MRFGMVLLGVMGVLGCAVESQAGPINFFGLPAASYGASHQSSFSMRGDFAAPGHLGSAARSPHWLQAILLSLESTPDSLMLDDHSRVASTGMSALAPREKDRPYHAQPKWKKNQCEGGPCRTTVPEPTTAMLLAIGSGLTAVSTRLRRRQ